MSMKNNSRKEFIEVIKDYQFDLLITLPVNQHYQVLSDLNSPIQMSRTIDTQSSYLSRLIVNINRSVFTRKELKQNKSINIIPVKEPYETAIHLLIQCPSSLRIQDNDLKHMKFKNIVLKEIQRMKLFNPYQTNTAKHEYDENEKSFTYYFKFFKRIQNPITAYTYITKRDKTQNLNSIDFLNVSVAT